jgi:hypothetical protein
VATARIGQTRVSGSSWLGWFFTVCAIVLASAGGVLFSRAWEAERWYDVYAAGFMLITATLMAVEGMCKRQPAVGPRASRGARAKSAAHDPDDTLPRLGEILVYKYHLISERDLKSALDRQIATGELLGKTLVDLGKLKWEDLAMALEDQISYAEPWRAMP